MARLDPKGRRFEFLVKRIDEALDSGFYVEAMALTYSLMEERTYKLMERLNIPRRNGDKLFQCLQYFQIHVSNNTITVVPNNCTQTELVTWLQQEFLTSGLICDIQTWRDERNTVTHDLAKQDIDYDNLKAVAQQGRDYFRRYTALIMKLKKMI